MNLYLVSTPIGNLEDISYRAVRLLQECDLILAEDTRHAKILLNHYEIKTPSKSFHQFNEAKREEEIIESLKAGTTIALISDAGTPGIADPGSRLVKTCREEGINVIPIGGSSAFLLALVASGFSTEKFQYLGFLPRKRGAFNTLMEEIGEYSGTSIAYESPKRIVKTLEWVHEVFPKTPVVVARELTKKFEEFLRGTPKELIDHFAIHPPKGEMVILFQEREQEAIDLSTLPEKIDAYLKKGHSKKEAITLVAKEFNIPKKVVYKASL